MKKSFWVYMLASDHYGTLYIGMTSDLVKRVWEHKNGVVDGFTKDRNVNKLVYFEKHDTADEAAKRERQLKEWQRDWKINLLERDNPHWNDLYETICN